jgi:RimJ/RimL family protein N-acetyltransferase
VSVVTIPRLETPRTVLREWRATNLDGVAAMYADPEVMRHLGGVIDRAQSWRRMAVSAGHWALRGYGTWVVERPGDGALLGRVGLWNPEGWPGLELGWTLARDAWGRGYATEAALAAVRWAWTVLDTARLISVIHPENARSRRVAQRLGMALQRQDTLDGEPVSIFAIARPDDQGAGARRPPGA